MATSACGFRGFRSGAAAAVTADNRSTLLSIAENAEVTGIGWRSLSRFYSLPDNLGGLRVLDLCSGMSDFAFSLRQRGALAYALDVLYGDLAAFRLRHRRSFGAITRDVFNVEPESEQAAEIYRSYVQGFESGLRRRPCFYVAGSATQLPFEADSFDMVTSCNGVFGALDFAPDLLLQALTEAVRVVKPGGSVQIVPYQSGLILGDAERDNQRTAIEALSRLPGIQLSSSIKQEAEPVGTIGKLTIRKID